MPRLLEAGHNKPVKEWLSSDTLKLVEERRNLKPKERIENRR